MNDFDDYVVHQIMDAVDASPVNVHFDEPRLHRLIASVRNDERSKVMQYLENIKSSGNLQLGMIEVLNAVIRIIGERK